MNELLIGAIDLTPYFEKYWQRRITLRAVPKPLVDTLICIRATESHERRCAVPCYFSTSEWAIAGVIHFEEHYFSHGPDGGWDTFEILLMNSLNTWDFRLAIEDYK